MPENIILIGYRGTGKSAVAGSLSKLTSKALFRVDEEIVKKTGKSIKDYVKENAWEEFRKIETEVIKRIKDIKNSVIDCGGGIIENKENIEILRKNGIIVWLKSGISTIIKRIKDSDERPSLTDKNFIEEVKDVLQKRNTLYKEYSDFEISTDEKSIEGVAQGIIDLINVETEICIPIIADTIEKAIADLKKAEKKADLIELRIDYIKGIDEEKLEEIIKSRTKKAIITCRTNKDNGKFEGTEEERIRLLKKAIKLEADYVDIESNVEEEVIKYLINTRNKTKIIISHHDFEKTLGLEELKKIYDKINQFNPDLVKIITTAGSLNDNFTVFNLLKNKKNLISFCMGLKGQVSRILAKKFDSKLSFASLEKGKESALGQLSVKELKEDYNFDSINKETKILGVIGEYAENSKSRFMHNKMFKEKGINHVYVPLKLEKEELEEFITNFKDYDFVGAAVTIPHKQEIMNYLDKIDETSQKIGAVNTIVLENDNLVGYNTDYYGAVEALKEKTSLKYKRILIVGAGGAAKAIIYGLKKEKSEMIVVNRTLEKAEDLAEKFNIQFDEVVHMRGLIEENDIIINTTNVGMYPDINNSIINESDLKPDKIIMDIVYTPLKTRLIQLAAKAGCEVITGERMLIYQAMKQFELWTKTKSDIKIMENALLNQLNKGE